MAGSRIEKDSLGDLAIPADAYYGINGVRAIKNFQISGLRAHPRFIDAFLVIKKSAALVNGELGLIQRNQARAIAAACDEILGGKLRNQFPVDVFQMGAGTALHMTINEVLANRAAEILGGKKGDYSKVHPNDHVNFGQSTNDVFPTAIRVAVRLYLNELLPVLEELAATLKGKGHQFDNVIKSARTHLQDAVPIRLGQEFMAYSLTVKKGTDRLRAAAREIEELGLGGSAAGTGLNTHKQYAAKVVRRIARETGIPFRPADDLREAMQSQRCLAEVSGALKNLSLELTRICNDFRLLVSGPTTGFAELVLPAVQAGSSIMPGKVNPSMAEMLNMVCFQVIGNDLALSLAVQAGQLELNVMMPLMAYDLLFSIEILKNGVSAFARRGVKGIKANKEKCRRYAEMSPSIATALNPLIGYAKAAEVVKEALGTEQSIVDVVLKKKLVAKDKLKNVLNLKKLTEPGVHK